MRKLILLLFSMLILLLLLTLPLHAQAQTGMSLDSLTVQLWPDHDQPSVLVIYDFVVDANAVLPVTVHFQIPSTATLSAVAKSNDLGLLNVESTPPPQGNGNVVTFVITDKTTYHLEYYMPYKLEGITRDFVFTWPGDYAVKSFKLSLQKPSASANLIVDPVLNDSPADKDSFEYVSTQVLTLNAQQNFTVHVRYDNESDTLSASTLTVKPSSSLTENVSGQISVMTYLPWILAVLALVLIVVGVGWYWYSSRSSTDAPKTGKRVIRKKPAGDVVDMDRQVYCHQCGKRARADDRFCRTCGVQLRQVE